MKLISTPSGRLLAKAMDAYALRQKAISSNIANMDTPGYKSQEVSFEDQLRQAQKMGTSVDTDRIEPSTHQTESKPVMENELMKLADNQIRFNFAARAMNISGSLLKNAVRERIG